MKKQSSTFRFMTMSFRFLGVNIFKRKDLIQKIIDLIGMNNGEIIIKVQNSKFVFIEPRYKIRENEDNDLESL